MKHMLLFSFFLSFTLFSFSQKQKTVQTDSGKVELYYRSNRTLAAYKQWETEDYGHCYVLDSAQHIAFKAFFGRRWGGGSCELKFHANGSVSEVHETFQPDGGIQYTNIYWDFDEKGNVTGKRDYSLGNDGHMHLFVEEPVIFSKDTSAQTREEYKQEIIEEAPVIAHEVYLWNTSAKKLLVVVKRKGATEADTLNLAPGDSVKAMTYIDFQPRPADQCTEITVIKPLKYGIVQYIAAVENKYYFLLGKTRKK